MSRKSEPRGSFKERPGRPDLEARKDLLAAAMYGHSGDEAAKLIEDYAHALAGRIRYADRTWAWVPDMSACDAADLIDPRAEDP
jgi:hypothetical protein